MHILVVPGRARHPPVVRITSTAYKNIRCYSPEGPFKHLQLAMESHYYPVWSGQSPLPYYGWLSHMLFLGYLGQTFGPIAAKRHICHNLLRYVEDDDDVVITQGLLRPDYSYLGLPGTFSVSHDIHSYLRCNAIAADNSRRIILDCEVAEDTTRVVPQILFAPYAGFPRGQAELQNTSLLPPIFFFRADHSVGLPLEIAKAANSHSSLLLYDNWCPMESKASIKLRIAVRCSLISQDYHLLTCCSGMAIGRG
jgi:hypothetical protein